MRLLTGPVCIVDQTAPKTTPRPTPRDASRINEVRTQLAPAVAGGFVGRRARRGAAMAMACFASKAWRRALGVCACVCGDRRRGAARSSKLGGLLKRAATANPGFDGTELMRRSKAEV